MSPDLERECSALLEEQRQLQADHQRLRATPDDRDGHRAHGKRLRAHKERLHSFSQRLHAEHQQKQTRRKPSE